MAYKKSVELDGQTYIVGAISVGQMRELHELRVANPARNFIEDNIFTISACLASGDPNQACKESDVALLPWPVYKKLLEAASDVSGFVLEAKTVGEATAASAIQ